MRAARNIPWLILVILALAALLRFFNLGSESLWVDEATSLRASDRALGSIVQFSISQDVHPPLYNILLHFWTLAFGQSEAAVRSLSACFGIVSVLLLYYVGRELFGRKVGLIASLLMAISAFAIAYSQETRAYSLLLLLTLLSFLLFIKILKGNKANKPLLLFYSLANILLCYTHLFGLFAIGAQILYFLSFRRRYEKARLAFWGTQAITLIGFSPWIFVLLTHTFRESIHTLNWIPEPSFRVVADSLGSLSGAGYLWLPLGVFLMLILLLLCLAGVFYSPKAEQPQPSNKLQHGSKLLGLWVSVAEPRIALMLVWFLFPVAASLIISVALRPIFVSRYLIGIIPPLYLLTARGIENVGPFVKARTTRAYVATFALILLLVVISLPGLYNYYANPQKEQWREAVNFVEQESKPFDVAVLYSDEERFLFNYYYKGNQEIPVMSYGVIENEETLTGKERLWLILRNYESTENALITNKLFARYGSDSLILQEEFQWIAVYLFDIKER